MSFVFFFCFRGLELIDWLPFLSFLRFVLCSLLVCVLILFVGVGWFELFSFSPFLIALVTQLY